MILQSNGRPSQGPLPHIHVTRHALDRYRERVDRRCDDATIRARIDTTHNRVAVRFGAPFIKLGTGQRLVIVDGSVVTVLPSGIWPQTLTGLANA